MLFSTIRGALGRRRHRHRKVAQLARALQRIPAPQRTVYLMCAVERRPQAAVAAALGISVAEVQERLADALLALALILNEEDRRTVAPDRPSS